VPYGEPTWLTKGYHNPYFKDSHRKLQEAMRKFVDEIIYPDAQQHEEDGKRPNQEVFDKMQYVFFRALFPVRSPINDGDV
jgi:hypothetical protein